MPVARLDHLVLTTPDLERTAAFYERVLGMRRERFQGDRLALHFGQQKINLHPAATPVQPCANTPQPGTLDLCFLMDEPLTAVAERLAAAEVAIELGPVMRTGAKGPIRSLYIRDPDGNLLELSELL